MDFFSGKNILITGANGYIGSSIVNKLKKTDCHLYLLSRKRGKSDKNITWYKYDISEHGVWKKILSEIDIVFHFAAQTSSVFANDHPLEDLKINLLPVLDFVETCKTLRYFPHIIFSGTVTEVGFTNSGKISEKYPDKPITVYDINKLAAEKYLQYYANELKGKATIIRLPNIYGPGLASSRADRGVVHLMIKKALQGEPITIFGSGKYVRDYLYIDDVVNAFIAAAKSADKTNAKYYVIGTNQGHTILQMAKLIKSEVEKKIKNEVKIIYQDFPTGTSRIEYRNFIANSSAFRRDTSWKSAIILQEGVRRTVEYFHKILSSKP